MEFLVDWFDLMDCRWKSSVSGVKRIVRELILLRGNYELTESKPVETKTESRLQRSMDRNRKNFRSRKVVKGGMACVHRLNNSIQI